MVMIATGSIVSGIRNFLRRLSTTIGIGAAPQKQAPSPLAWQASSRFAQRGNRQSGHSSIPLFAVETFFFVCADNNSACRIFGKRCPRLKLAQGAQRFRILNNQKMPRLFVVCGGGMTCCPDKFQNFVFRQFLSGLYFLIERRVSNPSYNSMGNSCKI